MEAFLLPEVTAYYTRCSAKSRQNYYKLKKEMHKSCRTAYNDYVASLVEDDRITKKLWTFIKSQRKDNCSIPPLLHEGNIHTNHMEKAEILNNYFASVFSANPSSPLPNLKESPIPDITSVSIDPHGVKCLLDGLDIHKSTGQITYLLVYLKNLAQNSLPSLLLFSKPPYTNAVYLKIGSSPE